MQEQGACAGSCDAHGGQRSTHGAYIWFLACRGVVVEREAREIIRGGGLAKDAIPRRGRSPDERPARILSEARCNGKRVESSRVESHCSKKYARLKAPAVQGLCCSEDKG